MRENDPNQPNDPYAEPVYDPSEPQEEFAEQEAQASDPASPPPVPLRAQPLNYRPGGSPEPKSQWLTDDQAFGGCMVYGLIGVTVAGTVIGVIGWIIWALAGF